jgi:hypothetical protein
LGEKKEVAKLKDLTGKVFGRLTVVEKVRKVKYKVWWLCKCSCGGTKIVGSWLLSTGKTSSCGCLKYGAKRRINIPIGKRFGKLVVLSESEVRGDAKHRVVFWKVRCDCGREVEVRSHSLRSKKIKTCGCSRLNKDAAFNAVFYSYKNNKRGLVFKLSREELRFLTSSNCRYCGVEPQGVSKSVASGTYVYNGIDRVDNKIGYILDNCVPCCSPCNRAKSSQSLEGFKNWIKRLINHNSPQQPA